MPDLEARFITQADVQCNVPGQTIAFRSYTTRSGIEVFPCDYLSKQDDVTCDLLDQRCLYRRERPTSVERVVEDPEKTVDTVYGDLVYNTETRELKKSPLWKPNPDDSISTESITLPHMQGLFLGKFIRHQGKIVTPRELYVATHPYKDYSDDDYPTVRVTLMSLRKNLGKEPEGTPGKDRLIATVINKGYILRKPNKQLPQGV